MTNWTRTQKQLVCKQTKCPEYLSVWCIWQNTAQSFDQFGQIVECLLQCWVFNAVCFCMAINCFSELPGFINFGSLGVLTVTILYICFPWRNAVVPWRNAVMAILLIGHPSDAMPANRTLLPFLEHVDLPVQKSCFSLNPHASFQALRVVINRAT